MKSLFYTVQLLLTTLSFLSWIPIPTSGYTGNGLYRMSLFFPVVGAFLGSIAALVLYFSSQFFPYSVSAAITLFVYGWVTGAFHEDALADVADGMGGQNQKQILCIMQDSSIGAYGSFAMVSFYVLRYAALSELSLDIAINSLITFAAVSRMAGALFLTLTHEEELPPESLSRTVLFSHCWTSCFLGILGTFTLVCLLNPNGLLMVSIVLILIPLVARFYFLNRIGCITGDCAGFVIYITETALFILATQVTSIY